MVSYSTSDFRTGLKILIEKDPCIIIEEDFVKPGKGQAFNKIKFRNLLTGRVGEKTVKVGESLEAADISEFEMQYLYSDGKDWYFMHPETFEQPISVMAPNFVDLEIVETDPGVKGDTVSGGSKPATLSTGAIIKVPLFLSKGEVVIIDTRTGEYQGRK